MRSRPEGHAGIDLDRDTFRFRRIQPDGQDDEPLANRNRLVVLFPGFHPVRIRDPLVDRRRQRLDHPQIIKRLFELLTLLFDVFVYLQIRTHNDRFAWRARIVVIQELDAPLGHHTVGRETRQYISDGFRQFAVYS